MDKLPLTIRVTATEKQMLRKRAAKYGLSVNALVRFWINTEPNSPRAFGKRKCISCNGTGIISGSHCKRCQSTGYLYYEV